LHEAALLIDAEFFTEHCNVDALAEDKVALKQAWQRAVDFWGAR
jgi:hypothetical protein